MPRLIVDDILPRTANAKPDLLELVNRFAAPLKLLFHFYRPYSIETPKSSALDDGHVRMMVGDMRWRSASLTGRISVLLKQVVAHHGRALEPTAALHAFVETVVRLAHSHASAAPPASSRRQTTNVARALKDFVDTRVMPLAAALATDGDDFRQRVSSAAAVAAVCAQHSATLDAAFAECAAISSGDDGTDSADGMSFGAFVTMLKGLEHLDRHLSFTTARHAFIKATLPLACASGDWVLPARPMDRAAMDEALCRIVAARHVAARDSTVDDPPPNATEVASWLEFFIETRLVPWLASLQLESPRKHDFTPR